MKVRYSKKIVDRSKYCIYQQNNSQYFINQYLLVQLITLFVFVLILKCPSAYLFAKKYDINVDLGKRKVDIIIKQHKNWARRVDYKITKSSKVHVI